MDAVDEPTFAFSDPHVEADDLPARYRVPGVNVAVPTLPLLARTLWGMGVWLGVPPLVVRAVARRGPPTLFFALQRGLMRQLARHLDMRLDIEGAEQIAPGECYVVAPLHEGLADPIALLHLPLRMRFVARDELFRWRVVGGFLRDTGQIEICPERGLWSYRELLREAGRVFAAGESVVVFPQGSILGIEAEFMVGAFALARAAQRPLLPIALTGSHRVWEHPYTPRVRYGQRVSLRVLPPIPAAQVQREGVEATRLTVQRQLKAAALDGTMAPPRRFVPARDGYWDGYTFRIDPAFPDLAADIAQHRAAMALGAK